jgi:maltooligosyltrehalose trehalohydrolase
MMRRRRYPIGAEPTGEGVSFRVWAPDRLRVDVVVSSDHPLEKDERGYWTGFLPGLRAGALYRYRLDGEEKAFPDPASRFQPEGPHGPSEVVDPSSFVWSDHEWRGVAADRRVVYEMHVGTFTPEGTFASAIPELLRLAELGITLLELMPVADFPGTFGWGYDGVDLWAPTRLYGRPDDFRRFVDAAHAAGIGVILDVVYNHLGPEGNYLAQFSKSYFSEEHDTDWGSAIDFDGERSEPVRELFTENAAYWIDEFHLDGLRFDATQAMFDRADREHILAAISRRARAAARERTLFLVAENDEQEAFIARSYGMDALWNDDFHHAAVAAVTGRREAYYSDTAGAPQELLSAIRWGYLFQGQRYAWQKRRRGHFALDLPASAFVTYIENHDQVSNSARGTRLSELTSPGRLRALTTLVLLAPPTPMLFQGQEYASTSPFVFFADHEGALREAVRKGRTDFLRRFPSIDDEVVRGLPDPGARPTFEACKLDPRERELKKEWLSLHADLLALRKNDPAFAMQRSDRIAGAVLGPEAFVVRFFSGPSGEGDRLLVVNLGAQLELLHVPEPLLASPRRDEWRVLFSTDDPKYLGPGIAQVEGEWGWRIPGEAAIVLG